MRGIHSKEAQWRKNSRASELEWTLVCVSYNPKKLFALKNLAVAA
jgi:hypothetical protein